MAIRRLILLAFAATTLAQSTSSASEESSTSTGSGTSQSDDGFFVTGLSTISPPSSTISGTYLSYETQSSRNATAAGNATATGNSTESQSTRTAQSPSLTALVGSASSTASQTIVGSGTGTNSAALPSNTLPCNNSPEFCNRQYSNITFVGAHNSAYVVANNAASNQELDTITQLNDGIRMIQGGVHWVNETMYNCHASCDILNAGLWEDQLRLVAEWLDDHPYEVITWLVGNSQYTEVENFVPAIQNSGIEPYLYIPTYIPQYRSQWPTLGEMILSGQRVVMFMDYDANQESVPYILDEFSHMWETPFSPTDPAFPCTIERPPGLDEDEARENFMYMANQNLNVAIDIAAIFGAEASEDPALLIPNTAEINNTNGQFNTFGQLGATRINCTEAWDRPPNFLLVDYYNIGDPEPGSVFQVAAEANGVEWTLPCCGEAAASGAVGMRRELGLMGGLVALAVGVAFGLGWRVV